MLSPLRQIAPQLSGRVPAALNFLTVHSGLIICALFLLAGSALVGDYGTHNDEEEQRRIARANLDYILGRADAVDATTLATYTDRVYGVAFELPLLLAERGLGLTDEYSIHRLRAILTHLFFIVGGWFCYRLAYRLFNNRLLALCALLFFLLHPRIYANSFMNSKDPPFITLFIIALYLLERAFRKDTVGAFVLLGIAVGLLTNLRIMGIMLFAAPLGLRGLDLCYAGSGPERKGILQVCISIPRTRRICLSIADKRDLRIGISGCAITAVGPAGRVWRPFPCRTIHQGNADGAVYPGAGELWSVALRAAP